MKNITSRFNLWVFNEKNGLQKVFHLKITNFPYTLIHTKKSRNFLSHEKKSRDFTGDRFSVYHLIASLKLWSLKNYLEEFLPNCDGGCFVMNNNQNKNNTVNYMIDSAICTKCNESNITPNETECIWQQVCRHQDVPIFQIRPCQTVCSPLIVIC